jgi:polyribonucleotide 5'-hydroxyl-kinase
LIRLALVNLIVVLGSERMYSELSKRFPPRPATNGGSSVSVVKLDKSGGCVDRDESYMVQARRASVREYFFGDAKMTLSPHTTVSSWADLSIFQLPESM